MSGFEIHTHGYHPKIAAMKAGMELRSKLRTYKEEINRKKQLVIRYWIARVRLAMDTLQHVDETWEAWYDDDRNVPDDATNKELALLLEARIRQFAPEYKTPVAKLYKGVFIWADRYQYSPNIICIFDTNELFHEFESEQDVKRFIDRLTDWTNLNDWKVVYGTFISEIGD